MSSSLFSVLQQVVMTEVKDRAATARERIQAATEKVIHEVVESETFKKHVAFNVEQHHQRPIADVDEYEEVITPAQAEPREPIGYVSVFVSRVAGLKASMSQIYIEAQVEGMTVCTPVSSEVKKFDWDQKMFDWEETAHTLKFPIFDIKADVAVRVISANVLSVDALIGQVLIPIERLLPNVWDEIRSSFFEKMEDKKTRFVEGPMVYELYPLPRTRLEFQPAVRNSAKTGMKKPAEPIGYARIRTEFVPNEAATARFWVTKAYFTTIPFMVKTKAASLQHITIDAARTQRHVNRQLTRIETILERIIFGPFAPTLAFSYARSWHSKPFSVIFVLVTSLAILHLPLFLTPLYMFCLLCVGGHLSRDLAETKPVVWNEDIRDPDDSLNPMQRLSKMMWLLETVSANLVYYADWLERLVHTFGFRDERASVIVLAFSFFSSLGLSTFAYFVPLRTFLFLAFCAWILAPIDFAARYQRIKYFMRSGKVVPYDRRLQPAVNLALRVPTSERLGHLSICEDQIVKNRAIVERVERIVVVEDS